MTFPLNRRSRSSKASRRARSRPRFVSWEALENRLVLSFAAPVMYPVGTQNTLGQNGFGPQVITGDFYGDGKLDLAATNTADGTLSLLRGNGDGTFQLAVTYSTGLGAGNPIWLAAADFDGNGRLDIAVEGNNGQVSLLLNNGNGSFATPKTYSVGTGNRGGLAAADYFGNGRQDIAVAAFTSTSSYVAILPNNGDGTFGTAVSVALPPAIKYIRSVTTANFFGNGHADLAVAGNEGYNNVNSTSDPAGVALFKNDGHGHFTYTAEYLAVTTPDPGGGNGQGDTVNPEHVNATDLNGDGKPDIVLSLYDHNIDVFLNNGDGTFKTAAPYTTETPGSVGGYPRGVAFGDFNGDGKVDLATLNFGEPIPADQSTPEPGSIGVLYGNGDGSFQAPIQYTPYQLPGGLAVGDFNGDGQPDLAITQNYTGHSVAVMLNQPNTADESPSVTGVTPATGPTTGGTRVSISGTNFTGTSQVAFGSVPSTAFTVYSNTLIVATAPAHPAGTVDVSVYNAGASATSPADHYTYTSVSLVPTVTGVSPYYGSTNGGTVVTITGSNFTSGSTVKFGSVLATAVTVNSSTSITATSPAEPAGLVDVTVTTPAASSAISSLDHFTFVAPYLAKISVAPSTATVMNGLTQLFVAMGLDQFGQPLRTRPTFTWSVSGLGSIQSTGFYTAPASGTGSATVKATSGTIYGTAAVTVVPNTETWIGLGATNNWSDPANWSNRAVPGPLATVLFSSVSTKSAFVDPAFAGTVATFEINNGYSGMISLGRSLTVDGGLYQANGIYDAGGFATAVSGVASLTGGTFEASTASQTLTGGLIVAGGTFTGSSGSVTTGNVTLSSGTLNAPSGTLYVTGGNFTYTGGDFHSDEGTVAYIGMAVTPTVSVGTGLVSFSNFTDALATPAPGSTLASLTITGTLTVNGTFAWKNGVNAINGNVEARGDVDDENHGGIGNPYLTIDGTANQKIEDLSGVGGGQFRNITINKSGGTLSLASNPIVFGSLALNAGMVSTGSDSWVVTGYLSTGLGLNLGNVEVDGSNVLVSGANLQVANLTFAASSDKLTAPTGKLFVSGNWNDSVGASFAANGGAVIFDGTGAAQFLTGGGQTFNNVTILAGSSVELEADVIVAGTFSNHGTFNPNGYKVLK